MKKILSVVLVLALLLGCASALAEAPAKEKLGVISVNGQYTIQAALPEGYKVAVRYADVFYVRAAITKDENSPKMELCVAYEDTNSDVERLNDLSDDDLALLEVSFLDQNDVEIEYRETAAGTKLMVVRETGDDQDFVVVFSIYKGCDVELKLIAPENASVTEEQVQQCVDFLSNLDFVPAN